MMSNEMKAVSQKVDELTLDQISAMLQQEDTTHYAPCRNYLRYRSPTVSAKHERIKEEWRVKICEWYFKIVDHFGFEREVVSVAVQYLDRVMATACNNQGSTVGQKEFQLTAVTCFYIAVKIHGLMDGSQRDEGDPCGQPQISIKTLKSVTRGEFDTETILDQERAILATLHWHVNPPTSIAFAAVFLPFLPDSLHPTVEQSLFQFARYLTELSACVSALSLDLKASEIAFAAILCAMEYLHINSSVPFPREAQMAFVNAISLATGLTTNTPNVSAAVSMLKDIAHNYFQNTTLSSNTSAATAPPFEIPKGTPGKTSPVSVYEVEDGRKGALLTRKRVHSTNDSST